MHYEPRNALVTSHAKTYTQNPTSQRCRTIMCASPPDPSGEGGLTQRAIMPWRYVGGHDLLVHLNLVLHLDVCVCVCVCVGG